MEEITNRTTKKQIMAMYVLCGDLKFCSKKLRDDEEVVLKFIEHSGYDFKYASDRLKKDREFIKHAIQKDVSCLLYADEQLRKDKKFILELIKLYNAKVVWYVSIALESKMLEHLKKPAIKYLKNELKKEGKL